MKHLQQNLGKETNQVWEEFDEESGGMLPEPDAQVFRRSGLGRVLRAHGVRRVFEAMTTLGIEPVPLSILYTIATRKRIKARVVRKILQALDACQPALGCCQVEPGKRLLGWIQDELCRLHTAALHCLVLGRRQGGYCWRIPDEGLTGAT